MTSFELSKLSKRLDKKVKVAENLPTDLIREEPKEDEL